MQLFRPLLCLRCLTCEWQIDFNPCFHVFGLISQASDDHYSHNDPGKQYLIYLLNWMRLSREVTLESAAFFLNPSFRWTAGCFESLWDTANQCHEMNMSNPLPLSPLCSSWILTWTPFRGSLSVRSDDARSLRKLLVSPDSLFPPYIPRHVPYLFIISCLTFFICPSAFLEQEINRSLSQRCPLPPPCPIPSAPQPRELITIEEECERLARELKEVST